MGRLYTFGCSFTSYLWPTWADIIGTQFDHFENWGRASFGNQFISQQVVECDILNDLGPDDTVVIVWSDHLRWDVVSKWNWTARRIADVDLDLGHFYLISMSSIYQTIQLLKSKNVKYHMSWLMPLNIDTADFYKNTITSIYRSQSQLLPFEKMLHGPNWFTGFEGGVFKYFFENTDRKHFKVWADDTNIRELFANRVIPEDSIYVDRHPTPLLHMKWVEYELADRLGLDVRPMRHQAKLWHKRLMEVPYRHEVPGEFAKDKSIRPVGITGNITR